MVYFSVSPYLRNEQGKENSINLLTSFLLFEQFDFDERAKILKDHYHLSKASNNLHYLFGIRKKRVRVIVDERYFI